MTTMPSLQTSELVQFQGSTAEWVPEPTTDPNCMDMTKAVSAILKSALTEDSLAKTKAREILARGETA